MRRLLPASLTIAVLLATAACGSGGADSGNTSKAGGTLTLAIVVPLQPWDLKDAGLGNNVSQYQPVYDSLLTLDPSAEPQPNLATKWTYDSSLTTLTLTLRSGVKFTDGTALDATAVKENLLHTKTGTSEAAGQLKAIKDVAVTDPTTVKVTLSAPDPSLVPNLGSVAGMIASPKALADGTLKTTPVGSGPYQLSTAGTTAGSQYTFTRNSSYWNAKLYPYDKLVLKYMTDQTAILNALRSGQINGANVTNPANIAPAKAAGIQVLTRKTGDVEGVYIWDRGGKICKPLANVKVRQAINYAFDRAAIVTTAKKGLGEEGLQVFNPDSTAYDAALNSTYSYDPAKAKALLAEAGYSSGFTCNTLDFSAFFPAQQAAMTEQLAAVGIILKPVTVPAEQIINQLLAGKFALSYFTLASFRSWDTVQIQLAKDSLWNLTKYDDPKMTELIAQAQRATGDEQTALFKEINKYTVDQAWNAPWDAVQATFFHTKDVAVKDQAFAAVPPIVNFSPAG